MYREVPTRPYTAPTPGARCSIEGCPHTVQEHIAEFRELMTHWTAPPKAKRAPVVDDPGALDRPAAAWSAAERMERANAELERYRQHLQGLKDAEAIDDAEIPF